MLGPKCLHESVFIAFDKLTFEKIVSNSHACFKFASVRSASKRFAYLRSALKRFACLRSTCIRFALLRLASLRFAPMRSTPVRSGIMSGFSFRHLFQASTPCLRIFRCSELASFYPSSDLVIN